MDIAPADKGENIRREVCLTLEQMGICPESSHHEEGPGQNEIDFRYSDPVTAADNAVTFRTVVDTAAARNGLWADFGPKPLADHPGNGLHINFSVTAADGRDVLPAAIAGILARISDMPLFLNPKEESYRRFGSCKAPRYISWSAENRSQLIRVPAAEGEYRRAELRSPDALCNPYLAFAVCLAAGLDGIEQGMTPPEEITENIYHMDDAALDAHGIQRLPGTLEAAIHAMAADSVVTDALGPHVTNQYVTGKLREWEEYRTQVSQWELERYLVTY